MKATSTTAFLLWGWGVFGATALALLLIDLLAHRREREQTRKRAIVWSAAWVGAGLLFNIFVWIAFGSEAAQEFLAAYLIEKSLSLDNLFVFLLIFQTLNIPAENRHRALFWGILGALVFRGVFMGLPFAPVAIPVSVVSQSPILASSDML